jgi:putative spermidine/putrescine transport system substrate-binding protein
LNAASDYDLGGLQGGAEAELAKANKILPWDLTKIPNFNTLWNWARDIQWAKWEGQQYGLPIAVNADSIIYLPEKTGLWIPMGWCSIDISGGKLRWKTPGSIA